MTPCPHCRKAGVSRAAKQQSSRERPATCTMCGRLSHIIASASSGIPGFTCAIALLCIVLGVASGYVGIGLAGIPLAIAYNLWAWERVELFPISGQAAARARTASWTVHLLALLSFLGL